MLDPETLPNRFTPQARQVSLGEHFEELYRSILTLHSLRARVQRQMVELPAFFNREAGLGRLRLRAEVRTPGGLPYRLSWILMSRSKLRFGLSSTLARKPKWPFKRVTIHSSRDLDSAIHRGLMDSRRSLIHRYHRKASTLNATSKQLTAALSGIRKLLGRFAPRERETARYLPPPTLGLPHDVRRCLWHLRGAILSLKSAQDKLESIANRYNTFNSVPEFLLGFVTDREHRYGRLLWVQREAGSYFSSLTDRVKRRLGLSESHRKLLTPYELERRSATRALTGITNVLKRVRLRIPAATRKANEILTLVDTRFSPIDLRLKVRGYRRTSADLRRPGRRKDLPALSVIRNPPDRGICHWRLLWDRIPVTRLTVLRHHIRFQLDFKSPRIKAGKDTRVENERREMMTVEECAAYTRLSRWTIYTFVCKKRIPYIKLGRRTLFDRAEIDRWIQSKSKKVSAVSLPRGVA